MEATNKFRDREKYVHARAEGENHQTVMSSFLRGMEASIAHRLYQMAKEKEGIVEKATGTALMIVKTDLIKADFEDTGVKLRKGGEKYKAPGSDLAYGEGKDAGKKVHIGTGIGHSPANKQIGGK